MKDKSLKNLPFRKILNSLWLGPLGGFLAVSIGAPIPFLIGPTAICSIAAFIGFNFVVPAPIRNLSFIIIGLTIGSNVTPDSLIQISKWPISLIFMTFSVLIVTVFGAYFLNSILWLDRKSSVLAASPGHLSFVLSISTDINGETAKIAVIQSTRVLILTFTTPLIVMLLTKDIALEQAINKSLTIPIIELFFLVVFSAFGGFLIQKTKVPAPYLISGMFFSTLGGGTTLISGDVPPILNVFAFITLGVLIGSRFVSIDMSLLRKSFSGGVLLTLIGAFFSFFFAYLTAKITGLNLVDCIIAFAPGGLETMIAMGTLVNADPSYVAIHHISRIFFLSFLVPFLIYKKPAT